MSMPDDPRDAPRGFFGRRKGHRLRAHQADLLHALLPKLAIDLTKSAPADLAALFSPSVEKVRLEIGFGGGEHLIAQAIAEPRTGFIGCEPFVNGMAKALAAIEEHGLSNIRLHHGDAVALLDWLPDKSLAGADLLYPDPWPKRRHWKRRFVQDDRIAAIARVLAPDREFHFVSDIPDYVAWTLERFLRSPNFTWTATRADDWRRPWNGFVGTRYEAKAVREGRAPCYLVFRRS
ncbi:MAG TPA: tRNA (guanine(46)-N(7))-methyltransferase TrmB [Xanthobacteraceae bacterium]|jgi:tRNA (guanine-N7-)-methyltransferase|nr:tRNA (guanine(46)-N(7))-methyltransferase TrmB [Xanthobacteraceae bacterium]